MENKIYDFWLNSPEVPIEMKEIMENEMSHEDIKQSFSDSPLVFGTAGYRAIMGPGNLYLNEFTYQQLAFGYGSFLKIKNPDKKRIRVVVAHDTRNNSLSFANVVAKTLTSMGIHVLFFEANDATPTPLVSYAIRSLKLEGGINITASHNPKNYNGFKAYNSNGGQLLPEDADLITKNIPNWKNNLSMKPQINNKLIYYIGNDLYKDYLRDIKNSIGLNDIAPSKEPIIVTTHHGALSNIKYFNFLKSLGHNIIFVNKQCYMDGNFENSPEMNPENKYSFHEARIVADYYKSNIMLGFDPDGDRLAVAIRHNDEWVYLTGNETGIIASYYLLRFKEHFDLVPIIISTYVTNNLINELVADYDGIVLRTGTGFKYIAHIMDQVFDDRSNFLLGFEEAIGMCISPNIREKDGLAAAALMLEIYKYYQQKNLSLVDLLNKQIYQKYGNWYGKTFSLTIETNNLKKRVAEIKESILEAKIEKIDQFKVKNITWNETGECVEIHMKDNRSWIKFRASGTEPKFKVYYNLYFDENNGYNTNDMQHQQKSFATHDIHDDLVDLFGIR